jgi:RNA polymerase sigma-32 factor
LARDWQQPSRVHPQNFSHSPDSRPSARLHGANPFKNARILPPEEVTELARTYRATGDPAAARKLTESHLRLVVKIARQCASHRIPLADLVQEGCLGLMRAVEKYDPDRGIRLSSYAAWWIRAFIYQHILANFRTMRIATTFTQRKLFFNLNRECRRLERDGEEALSKDIAQRMGVSEQAVDEMRARLGSHEVSFEATVAVDSTLHHTGLDAASPSRRPDDIVEQTLLHSEIARRVDQIATTLNLRDRAILDDRLRSDEPATLRQLGKRLGVSKERVRQLEEGLKHRLRGSLGDLVGESVRTMEATA